MSKVTKVLELRAELGKILDTGKGSFEEYDKIEEEMTTLRCVFTDTEEDEFQIRLHKEIYKL